MKSKIFYVTSDHLKLLPHLWFDYDDWTEFGAPEVDPKRPYGNSDVYSDIAEHLGMEPGGEEDGYGDKDFTEVQRRYMLQLHKDMTTVLNIMVRNNGVELGTYEASPYGVDWKKKS